MVIRDNFAEFQLIAILEPGLVDGLAIEHCSVGRVQVLQKKIAIFMGDFGVRNRNRRIIQGYGISLHPADGQHLVPENMIHSRKTWKLDGQ
jgi:hypothetical protein